MHAYDGLSLRNLICCAFLEAIVLLSFSGLATADSINPGVYSKDSKPHGIPYEVWQTKFWQWLHAIPESLSPAKDMTGKNCALNQSGPVWYLPGTFGDKAVRTCTIPAGKSILISAINMLASSAEHGLRDEASLRTLANEDQDRARCLEVKIDGKAVKNLKDYRADSPLFTLALARDNNLGKYPEDVKADGEWISIESTATGEPVIKTKAVSDGHWVMLEPLSPGEHTIEAQGCILEQPVTFVSDVEYNITVTP